jgi:vacuolar-type H+-ATPase subunit E/Vma4
MGLDNLVDEIMRSASEDADHMERETKDRCAQIVKDAELAAEQKLAKAKEDTQKSVEAEKSERIAAARLQAKKLIEDAHEGAVNSVLDEAWHKVAARAKSRDYPKLLKRLIEKGAKELGRKDFVVMVRSADRKAAKDMKYSLSEDSAECEGGAVVMSSDEKVRVDMTFEALFASKKEDLRKQIYTALFGKRMAEIPKAMKAEPKRAAKKGSKKAKPAKKKKR